MAKKKRLFLSRMAENIARAEDAKARVRTAAALTEAEAYAFLRTERGGITKAEAERRRELYGENVPPSRKKKGGAAAFWRPPRPQAFRSSAVQTAFSGR